MLLPHAPIHRLSSLQDLAARATLTCLSNHIRRGQVGKRRRSYWRSHLRNILPPHVREMLLELVIPEGRLCDTVQFVLLDILFCPNIAKLALRYVRAWYQDPIAKIILSWRASGVKQLLLEDISWLGVDCCPPGSPPSTAPMLSTSSYSPARMSPTTRCKRVPCCGTKRPKDLWATSDRAVLVFDTPAPPCPCRLLSYLVSAMPALTHVQLKYICGDATLAALGRYCHHLTSLDCSWSPRVTNQGLAMLLLSLPSTTSHQLLTDDGPLSSGTAGESWVFPKRLTTSTDKKRRKCWKKLTATLAFRFSDIFVPIFSRADPADESRTTLPMSWPSVLPTTARVQNNPSGEGHLDILSAVVAFVSENPSSAPDDIPLTRCLATRRKLRMVNIRGTAASRDPVVSSFFAALAPSVNLLT